MSLSVKIADTPQEFEQIHRLNYQTFVQEIPQHADKSNPQEILVDKFHAKNTYFIVLDHDEVVGMVAHCDQRPFSLDAKLTLDNYLNADWVSPCEIRLLTVKPSHRNNKRILSLLLEACIEYAFAVKANDCALITAYDKQVKLYQGLGFHPFGPTLTSGTLEFQAMALPLEQMPYNFAYQRFIATHNHTTAEPAYFLTGPVRPFAGVEAAAQRLAISHRSTTFNQLFQETCSKLTRLVNAKYVHMVMGNGSLANAIIAAQLTQLPQPGLILTNGEFSERLADHAKRAQLDFHTIAKPWGTAFDPAEIEAILRANPNIGWLWTTHCETSTGMLNDLALLKQLSQKYGIKLVLDCVSSIGTVPVDLDQVYLASASSAKALGAKSGLALVFYNHTISNQSPLPAILDLAFSASKKGIPFTISSHLVAALHQALVWFDNPGVWKRTEIFSNIIRNELQRRCIPILIPSAQASPAIITVCPPPTISAYAVGEQCAARGVLLNYASDYLRSRNWLQISLMGHFYHKDIAALIAQLDLFLAPEKQEEFACSA